MANKPHHQDRRFVVEGRAIRATANANPDTICWRCGETLEQARKHHPHTRWTAGHLRDGDPTAGLAPEHSHCNYSAGATAGNARRQSTYHW